MQISDDSGKTWQTARYQLPNGDPGGFVGSSRIATSATQPLIAYAETHPLNLRGRHGLHFSDDGGLTWQLRTREIRGGQLAVDPRDPDVVYLSTGSLPGATVNSRQLLRSVDGGVTVDVLATFPSGVTALHIAEDGGAFWLATRDGRLHRSTDFGATWMSMARTSPETWIVSLWVSAHDPTVVFTVTNHEQLWAYREPSGPTPE
jgi:hypothetical protein